MNQNKEIGGYIEFERFRGSHYHEGAIKLNCGRGCLSFLIEARKIESIWLPYFICSSVVDRCISHNVAIKRYYIDDEFQPLWNFAPLENDYLYLVSYYGQMTDRSIQKALELFDGHVIVDGSQSFFTRPPVGVDTLYTARKYFGVSDGGYLYTDARLRRELPRDESHDRMRYLMGRLECGATEFFEESKANNRVFDVEPAKLMSYTTMSLLSAVDYDTVREARERNFTVLNDALKHKNALKIRNLAGPFAYPFLVKNGPTVRKELAKKRIYIPILWPNVLQEMDSSSIEYRYAHDILPIPVDHRYNEDDMRIILAALHAEGVA